MTIAYYLFLFAVAHVLAQSLDECGQQDCTGFGIQKYIIVHQFSHQGELCFSLFINWKWMQEIVCNLSALRDVENEIQVRENRIKVLQALSLDGLLGR